jgi:hypothetical protein
MTSPQAVKDLEARLVALAHVAPAATPVLSVYLDTGWGDEHQRERVRIALKNFLRRAGEDPRVDPEDARWIGEQGLGLVAQAVAPGARGAALFACRARGLRELFTVRAPFEPAFAIGDAPQLVPLAAAVAAERPALVVFVDGESARLIPWGPDGAGDDVTLESEVPGHHRRGGWAQLAQSGYQRHIQDHRDRHFEAVGRALGALAATWEPDRIVLAGERRHVVAFQETLTEPWAGRVVGHVPAARYESGAVLVDRASGLLARLAAGSADVDAVLVDAAKGGAAAAGVERTLDGVARGAVRDLYLLRGFRARGRACAACGALAREAGAACPACGAPARAVELGEAMAARVVAAGGRVEQVDVHAELERLGGVAARLRYPI